MKRVFSIEQFSIIEPDERAIDAGLAVAISSDGRKEENERLHRLYHADEVPRERFQ